VEIIDIHEAKINLSRLMARPSRKVWPCWQWTEPSRNTVVLSGWC